MTTDIDPSSLTGFLEKNSVKFFPADEDIYNVINTFLERDVHEEAFFIVDLGKIIRQYTKWKKHLPNVVPYYAVKCNPNPVIIQTLHMLGCHFDCASKNEISTVCDLVGDSAKIIFANPCKMCNHIKFARATDVDLMTFDCEEELYKIKLYHPYAKLVLRIAVDDTKSAIGFSDKYGARDDQVADLARLCRALRLQLVGVSFHVGTGCYDGAQFADAIARCRAAYDVCARENVAISLIDIGGGFPGIDTPDITFEGVAVQIQDAIAQHFGDVEGITFIAEPGRFFVASSHTLVVNVIGKKVNVGEDGEKEFVYYINDGVYGSFNCVYFEKTVPDIQPFNERDGKRYRTKIFGPTCDSIDVIVQQTHLPELVIGEWCYIEHFGAYTSALASNFNGFAKTQIHHIFTN